VILTASECNGFELCGKGLNKLVAVDNPVVGYCRMCCCVAIVSEDPTVSVFRVEV
jgi:hypothetical protein